MRTIEVTKAHEECYADIIAALKKHSEKLMPEDILALLAMTTGRTLAMLDQTRFTPAAGIEIIRLNIEKGNQDMIAEVSGQPKGHA